MNEASDMALFFGRFHPLVVHLPIGLIVLLAGLELLAWIPRFRAANAGTGYILAFAVPGALLTTLFGWLLAGSGGYDDQLLQWHRWTGVGTAAACGVAAALYFFGRKRLYRVCLFATASVLVVASHFGGSLTHGSDYLARHAPASLRPLLTRMTRFPSRAVLASPPSAQTAAESHDIQAFAGLIQPILNDTCVSCHGLGKSKGKLRLDNFAALMQGSESGPVVVPGKSAESLLLQRVQLPLEDEDHMPPEGKPQPSAEDLSLLAWWIDAGASAEKTVAELKPPAPIARILAARFKPAADPPPAPVADATPPETAEKVWPVASALAGELGLAISQLAPDQPWLECNAGTLGTNFGNADLAKLAAFGRNIRWLDLGGTGVSDAGLAHVAAMPNLSRLHLERTAITDAGLDCLTNLAQLDYLNLYGTPVTDSGLEKLTRLPRLKQVYLWQTQVSPEGAKAFTEARTDQAQLQRWREEIEQLKAKIKEVQISVDLGTALAVTAPATNSMPVNTQCPVSGNPAETSKTVVYGGKVVAFCCDDCKAKFQQDPLPFLTKLGLAATTDPKDPDPNPPPRLGP